MKQKGFAPIVILLAIAVLAGLTGVYFFTRQSAQSTPPPSPTQTPSQPSDKTANWKQFISPNGYSIKYPSTWIYSNSNTSDPNVLDSLCFGLKERIEAKCLLTISVLKGDSWDKEKQLLGLTLSSPTGTQEVSFAGVKGLKRTGLFGEEGSLSGFVILLNKGNSVYKIWAYEQVNGQENYTEIINQILSTFRFD